MWLDQGLRKLWPVLMQVGPIAYFWMGQGLRQVGPRLTAGCVRSLARPRLTSDWVMSLRLRLESSRNPLNSEYNQYVKMHIRFHVVSNRRQWNHDYTPSVKMYLPTGLKPTYRQARPQPNISPDTVKRLTQLEASLVAAKGMTQLFVSLDPA